MSWPQDEDGDVFRNLEQDGFDFSAEVPIEFYVDVADPANIGFAIDAALEIYPDAAIGLEDEFFVVQLEARLTYDLVIDAQKKLTAATAKLGGNCDSWAVMHEGPEE
jgi:Regulator of ribonuclease activity B